MKILGIIPARYASSRFPGKPLVDIRGISMIMRVVNQARQCASFEEVIVATDDQRIFDHVSANGARVVMTSDQHPSGTDRCREALTLSGSDAEAVVNIQGDEPFVDPAQLEALCDLIRRPGVEIATLAKRIDSADSLADPHKVKVVFSSLGKALYFSRQAIPFIKDVLPGEWHKAHSCFRHLGLYAYRRDVLEAISLLPPSPLEIAESLEQLRWLEAGYAIHVAETQIETPAIDTPDDLLHLSFPSA